ncbi:hypothetical protein COCVIDRAFT_26195 [Bipolaris victoriae FI3]|uniref:Uncharacterized protein n=1 Tax=Bipolaris victoriae (strain FI3) TaxID=930091 RepID=W7EKV0_BIPV3|nr:hypothetical protein COCVIDRAFT_26195 [Bipolaris victoriae FI3]
MAPLSQNLFEMDNNNDKSEPFDDACKTKIIRHTAGAFHISGWNPINGTSGKSVKDWAHWKSDLKYSPHNALDDEPIDPDFDEKYFDHYGYFNYINSAHEENSTTADGQEVTSSSVSVLQRTPKRPKTSHEYLARETDEAGDLQEPDTVFTQQATASNNVWRPYTAEEVAWLDLFHAKLRGAIEAGAVIKLPGRVPILETFNTFFKRKAFEEREDGAAAAGASEWTPRTMGSMHRKLRYDGSKVGEEREKLSKLLEDRKNGRVYVPKLSVEELAAYQRDGTVVLDDLRAEGFEYCFVGTLRGIGREILKRRVEE